MATTEVRETHVTGTADPVVTTTPAVASHTRQTTVRRPGSTAASLVWLVVGILDVVLAFDFMFRALKANATGFADFIYSLGGGLAAPFDGIFGVVINNQSMVIRWADLLAIAIYTLVGMAIVSLIRITVDREDTVTTGTTQL